jgi:hypothetical protein
VSRWSPHRGSDEDATWPFKLDRALSLEENRLECAVRLANRRIFEYATIDIAKRGMEATIVAATVRGRARRSREPQRWRGYVTTIVVHCVE